MVILVSVIYGSFTILNFTLVKTQHEIYSLNKLSVHCGVFDYSHYAVLYISRSYPSCLTAALRLLIRNSPISPPPSPWKATFHSDSTNLAIFQFLM